MLWIKSSEWNRVRSIVIKGVVYKETVVLGELYTKFFAFFSEEGLKRSAFRIPVRWSIYIINSIDKTKIFVYSR